MKKILKIEILILLMLSGLCLTACSFTKPDDAQIENLALEYLCEKYGVNKDEFELVKYQSDQIVWLDKGELLEVPDYADYSFEYLYKDRNFFVVRSKGRFYDDYQLEDIEEWCTKWLRDNGDKNFNGFRLGTKEIIYYSEQHNNSVITENDAENFLRSYAFASSNSSNYLSTYYYYNTSWKNKKLNNDEEKQLKKELGELLENKINENNECIITFSTEHGEIKYSHTKYGEWYRVFEKQWSIN